MKNVKNVATSLSVIISLSVASVCTSSLVAAISPINPSVKLDGKIINFPDTQPYINEDSRTMVPVRFVSEALGCDVKWEETNQMVTITKAQKRILLQIGQNWAIVNDTKQDIRKEFDTKAVLKNERTMVPLRFVSETLGVGVAWDEVNNTAILRSDGIIEPVATPTPTPIATPAPTISYKNYVETFDLVEGFNPPEGFVVPKMRIIHNWDSSPEGWFDVRLDNLWDYNNAGNYAIKATCTNLDITNTAINYNGEVDRLDGWKNPMTAINRKMKGLSLWSAHKTIYSESVGVPKLKLKDGDVLDIQVIVRSDYYEQVYSKSVTIHAQ